MYKIGRVLSIAILNHKNISGRFEVSVFGGGCLDMPCDPNMFSNCSTNKSRYIVKEGKF